MKSFHYMMVKLGFCTKNDDMDKSVHIINDYMLLHEW